MATSGPGATNLVTAIADAYMDSIPLVAITGQVPQEMIGRGAFQETDFFGMTLPVVKHSYLVMDINGSRGWSKKLFILPNRPARSGGDRFPEDVQNQTTQPICPQDLTLRGYDLPPQADPVALNEVIGLIKLARRPMIYAGGGIISSHGAAEALGIRGTDPHPRGTTFMGIGGFPEDHPLSLKWLGDARHRLR